MRLLLVTSVYPAPRRPTQGTFNREMVRALRTAGDDVRVVVPVPWTDLFRHRAVAAAETDSLHPIWFYPPRLAHATHHHWMARIIPRVERALGTWRPELVLGYWAHPDGTTALALARKFGVPGVVMVGGSDVQLLVDAPRRRAVITETLTAADRVLTIGPVLRERVLALGIAPERVTVHSRGVDIARFRPGDPAAARQTLGLPRDRVIFLWAGRMVPVKGLDLLLDAWATVVRSHPNALLVLVGDGAQQPALSRAAESLGDTIRFVGSVAHDALPAWYRAADAIVLSSRSEGVPNVLLEGLACGTPFIATDVGGVSGLLAPGCTLVPAGDVTALATAIGARAALPPLGGRIEARIPDRNSAIAALRGELSRVAQASRGAA